MIKKEESLYWKAAKEVFHDCKFSFLFLIIVIGVLYYGTYAHELVHQQILNSYGLPSEIKVHWTGSGVTTYKGDCNELCQMSHNINEAVGYNLGDIKFILALGFFFVILFLEMSYNLKEKEAMERYLEKAEKNYLNRQLPLLNQ